MQLVDSDGSEMIEFDEFLDIIKGGRADAKAVIDPVTKKMLNKCGSAVKPAAQAQEGGGTGAIFNFFTDFADRKF